MDDDYPDKKVHTEHHIFISTEIGRRRQWQEDMRDLKRSVARYLVLGAVAVVFVLVYWGMLAWRTGVVE